MVAWKHHCALHNTVNEVCVCLCMYKHVYFVCCPYALTLVSLFIGHFMHPTRVVMTTSACIYSETLELHLATKEGGRMLSHSHTPCDGTLSALVVAGLQPLNVLKWLWWGKPGCVCRQGAELGVTWSKPL